MFGLFKKKNKKEEVKSEHPDYVLLVKKWDDFLGKIDARFNESLVHAEEAVLENLDATNFDLTPTLRAWGGIKSQLQGLTEKIDDTFDDKVQPQMLEYKEGYELIDEGQKGAMLSDSIYHRLERYERILEGKIAQNFYDHAIELLNENFSCTQCSAKLEVKKDIFRSHYVSCQYCNTVNTFTPNSKIGEIQWYAVDNIAKHKALVEWDVLQKAEKDFSEINCPSEKDDKTEYKAGFKSREIAEQKYWTKFLNERIALLPDNKESFGHDLSVKMKPFYEERMRELNY